MTPRRSHASDLILNLQGVNLLKLNNIKILYKILVLYLKVGGKILFFKEFEVNEFA